ncbi:MAG: phage integrase N-terminal SAM-like domain-containing protein, partial [candidate division WOR-3 bacterium]|nr:phage integrase N-terminal SAM-like domain-containing protein [candidate division WOR-3 bacterium]
MRDDRIKIINRQSGEIAVVLPFNPVHIEKVKKIKGHRWNPKEKCWTFPRSKDTIISLLDIFRDKNVWIEPSLKSVVGQTFTGSAESHKNGSRKLQLAYITLFEDLRRELVSRKYSSKTIKAYIHYNRDFLEFVGKKPDNITDGDIKDYLFHLVEEKKVATSTLNSDINALKFYYGTMLKRKFAYEVKRPRKDKKLPVVLSKEEVAKILSSVDNVKHKAILMLVYSAGLRVGEAVKLKPEDIDSKRMLVYVRGGKG